VEVIKAYPTRSNHCNLDTLPVKRTWMDETWQKHAYHCFPVTLANTLGWQISFPKDISFIWDGISDSNPNHVKIIEGKEYAYPARANATVSFTTGMKFKTEKNKTLLIMPAPNYFIQGAQCFTTLISTSFFRADLPVAWMINEKNKKITIPAGFPICSIIPISLSELNNSEIHIEEGDLDPNKILETELYDYSKAVNDINKKGEWSNFYRDGVDHRGNSLGVHEVKSLKLKVKKHSV